MTKALIIIGEFIQLSLFVALVVIEKLTQSKAGVNKHLYYRRSQFTRNILKEDVITMLTILLIIIIVALIVYVIKLRNRSNNIEKFMNFQGIVMSVITISALYLSFFKDLYIYPYLLAVLFVCIIISSSLLIFLRKCS